MVDCPFEASKPITSQENCFTLTCWPTASRPPKSSLRTVSPITHTAAPARSSASLKIRPLVICHLPVANQSAVLPVTLLDQLRAMATRVTLLPLTGTAAASPLTWLRTASASATRKLAAPAESLPGPSCWPGRTIRRLLPRLEI